MNADNTIRLGPGDDLQMFKTPDLWPLGAVLPLKHSNHLNRPTLRDGVGILVNRPGFARWTVWHVNIMETEPLRKLLRGEDGHGIDATVYTDAEAIYDAGWRLG